MRHISKVEGTTNMVEITRADAVAMLTAPGQTYELEEIVVNGVTCRAFTNAPRSLRALYPNRRSTAAKDGLWQDIQAATPGGSYRESSGGFRR